MGCAFLLSLVGKLHPVLKQYSGTHFPQPTPSGKYDPEFGRKPGRIFPSVRDALSFSRVANLGRGSFSFPGRQSAKPSALTARVAKRAPSQISYPRPLLSCGEIGTVWAAWATNQSLFHRNLQRLVQRNLTPLHQSQQWQCRCTGKASERRPGRTSWHEKGEALTFWSCLAF